MNEIASSHQSPFKAGERRCHTGNNATISEILKVSPENDSLAIKEGWLLKTYNRARKQGNKSLPQPDITEITGHIKTLEKDLKEFLPEHHLVISQGKEGGRVMNVVVMEVKSAPLNQANKRAMAEQMDGLIEKSLQTYFNTYSEKSGKGMAADLKPESVIFGTTIKDNKPRLYFVDFFPLTQRTPNQLQNDIAWLTKSLAAEYGFPKTNIALEKLKELNEF